MPLDLSFTNREDECHLLTTEGRWYFSRGISLRNPFAIDVHATNAKKESRQKCQHVDSRHERPPCQLLPASSNKVVSKVSIMYPERSSNAVRVPRSEQCCGNPDKVAEYADTSGQYKRQASRDNDERRPHHPAENRIVVKMPTSAKYPNEDDLRSRMVVQSSCHEQIRDSNAPSSFRPFGAQATISW